MVVLRRSILAVSAAVLIIGTAYTAGAADHDAWLPWQESDVATKERDDIASQEPSATPSKPATPAKPAAPKPTAEPEPVVEPVESQEPTPELTPGPRLLGTGDSGDAVRDLQARLRQIRWFNRDVTGYYGDVTATAVRGFQAKRGFPVTGEVDQRTLDRLHEMSREPTQAELTNQPPNTGNEPGALDPRCATGRVLCIDKTSRTLRWVVDGTVHKTVDVRFGRESMPTREGTFRVEWKSRDHVSSIYDTPMPYAMFFSGGQAVHYSPDFAATGYNGASHGCVNVRDRAAVAWLFDQVRVGDRVVVYWS